MNNIKTKQSGYASVTLLVFIVIGMTITMAATSTILINSLAASRMQQGIVALNVAESGIENGIIRFLRDPVNYTGETQTHANGTVIITVATDKKSITSVGTSGNYLRKIKADIDYTNSLHITSWKEIY